MEKKEKTILVILDGWGSGPGRGTGWFCHCPGPYSIHVPDLAGASMLSAPALPSIFLVYLHDYFC